MTDDIDLEAVLRDGGDGQFNMLQGGDDFTDILLDETLLDSNDSDQIIEDLLDDDPQLRDNTKSDELLDNIDSSVHQSTTSQTSSSHTLRTWIDITKSNYTTGYLPNEQVDDSYIRAALPVALKLIDLLVRPSHKSQEVQENSIKAENVLVYSRDETLDVVLINNSQQHPGHDSPSSSADDHNGSVQSKLFAVGLILYELFSTEEPLAGDLPPRSNTYASVQGIDLDSTTYDELPVLHHPPLPIVTSSDQRPQKRTYQSSQTGDKVDTCIAKLEGKGLPRSIAICTLVKNLLDCSRGDYCGDEAYSSFVDLRQDLLLMMNDPTRFLDDLQVGTSLPTLEICDKLYGRQEEEARLNELYQQFINEKKFKGVVISGGAGAGKSMLALHTQRLTSQFNGHFCSAKFEQNEMNNQPLATIGGIFNRLCELFAAEGLSPNELELVEKELENRLGDQACLLAGVVPSLFLLMPSSVRHHLDTASSCMNAAVSMRYLFCELLRVISSNSKRPISLFIDDLQFADSASLLLIGDLLFTTTMSGVSIFLTLCHRDDEESLVNTSFGIWLSSLSIFPDLKAIELKNMSAESVNTLVSDTLHLSPRITRPLSAILHHKTRGNPLFLRQLLGSLYRQGYIYVDLSISRWAWDTDKIEQEPVSSSVIALLTKEMKDLPSSLQLGLGVASCLGSSVKKEVLDILSKDLNVDLVDILKEVSQKGFMTNIKGGEMFRFTHDKIQEAGMYYLFVWMVLILQLVRFLPHSH